ncbi:MAG TPA: cytochrome b/b6 domain-containing protein [Woeseiaceae bacterium]|nr:cytochrome b/b6 domain-containing protein [Woeseiaceae bacterium]
MDLATYKEDVWGREVILGASWELLWLVVVSAFVVIALHAVVLAVRRRGARPSSAGPRVARHSAIDRLFHWIMAVAVIALLITGVLPIIGLEFSWLTIHWIAGLVLTASVVFHIVRSLFWQDLKSMWISARDLKEPFDATIRPGKYSVAQKSMHAAVTVLVLLVIGSGLVMFAMIDTPWWDRSNSIAESTLGWVFLIHGLSTIALIALICLHVYFGLRPEKLFYTRSMIKGWISKEELEANHDPERWAPGKSS